MSSLEARTTIFPRFGRDRRSKALLGAVVAFAIVYPIIDRNASHVSSATDAGVFVLLALGLNIVVGYAGLLDLGYAAFFAIGSYAYGFLASPHMGIHIAFWLMLPIAGLAAGLFGVILGAPTLRLRGDYLAIVTLGFGEIVPVGQVHQRPQRHQRARPAIHWPVQLRAQSAAVLFRGAGIDRAIRGGDSPAARLAPGTGLDGHPGR